MIDAKSDKKRGEDIDGVMKMAEQDDGPKKEWKKHESPSEDFLVPKYQCHQKRKARVARKEEITCEGKGVDDKTVSVEGGLLKGGGQMG